MSLLNFEKSEFKRTGEKKTFAIILGIGALVGVVAIGSTLAASINLNSGTPVEFGQGVAQTTACDDNVIVTPQSTFVNSEENADFFFNSLSVTDISSECDGKTFTIKAFKNGQNTALELYSSNGTPYSEINVKDESGSFSFVGGGLLSGDIEDVFGGFSVTIDNALVSGQDLNRITIESKDSPTVYVVGQTGPGGGTIYYVDNGAGFNCGSDFTATCNYLEVAPSGWNNGLDPQKYWAVDSKRNENVIGVTDNNTVLPYNNAMDIGLGFRNSDAIVSQGNDSTTAAGIARAYTGGFKYDWYLPTTAELNLLCQWSHGEVSSVTTPCSVGTNNSSTYGAGSAGFNDGVYWSSSEFDDNWAWYQSFVDGYQAKNFKQAIPDVRPIRAF